MEKGQEEKKIFGGNSKKTRTSYNNAFTLRENHPRSARSIFGGVESADNPALAKSSTRQTDRCA